MSDSAPSMYYFTITLFVPAVGETRFLQWEPAASPSLAYLRLRWLCSWMCTWDGFQGKAVMVTLWLVFT